MQQHEFNLPYQLGSPELIPESDTVDDAAVYEIDAEAGDVLILGTDGLFDNMWNDQLARIVNTHIQVPASALLPCLSCPFSRLLPAPSRPSRDPARVSSCPCTRPLLSLHKSFARPCTRFLAALADIFFFLASGFCCRSKGCCWSCTDLLRDSVAVQPACPPEPLVVVMQPACAVIDES